jgi:L-amino acid N-acyltransferase YncA
MSIIRSATNKDIPGILAVLHHNLMANKKIKDKNQLEQTGFIIHDFTADDLEAIIADSQHHILLVAIEDDKVIGYILTYDMPYAKPDWLSLVVASPQIKDILAAKEVLYHRNIAKKHNKKGVGKQLLQVLLQEAAARNYKYVACQIVQQPYKNKVSIALHEQLGFKAVGHGYEADVDITFGVYLKRL